MRLTSKEIHTIKTTVNRFFEDSSVYLFGSRVDDSRKGGDIDLYIETGEKDTYTKKLRVKSILEDLLYKPVDIVISKDKAMSALKVGQFQKSAIIKYSTEIGRRKALPPPVRA